MNGKMSPCFACGGLFAGGTGPSHDYMLSSTGCWEAYGVLLAREYESAALYEAVHRLTVDAYALQHAGDRNDRRAVQSVWVHYVALRLTFEGHPPTRVRAIMQQLIKLKFPELPGRPAEFVLTHAYVLAGAVDQHEQRVRSWAESAFDAWSILRDPADNLLRRLQSE